MFPMFDPNFVQNDILFEYSQHARTQLVDISIPPQSPAMVQYQLHGSMHTWHIGTASSSLSHSIDDLLFVVLRKTIQRRPARYDRSADASAAATIDRPVQFQRVVCGGWVVWNTGGTAASCFCLCQCLCVMHPPRSTDEAQGLKAPVRQRGLWSRVSYWYFYASCATK